MNIIAILNLNTDKYIQQCKSIIFFSEVIKITQPEIPDLQSADNYNCLLKHKKYGFKNIYQKTYTYTFDRTIISSEKKKGILKMKNKIYLSKKADLLSMICVSLAFTAVCIGVLAVPKISIEGAKSGISYSLGILIPSLFPFMFLSGFAVEYGISRKLGRILSPFTEKILYLPSEAGVTVLLSLIGGFPVGAVGISALFKQGKITEKQAQRMLCFCVNSGPAFLISVVGTELYDSEMIGIILLTAQTIASLIIGAVLGLLARRKEPLQRSVAVSGGRNSFSSAFVISAKNASVSTVNLCALVVLFSSFESVLMNILKIDSSSPSGMALKAILEVTDGCSCLAENHVPIFLTALAIGWSGICVHFQIYASAENININKLVFLTGRIFCGLLSGLLTYFATLLIVTDTDAFSNISKTTESFSSSSIYGSLALFVSCILFLIFMNTYINGIISKESSEASA